MNFEENFFLTILFLILFVLALFPNAKYFLRSKEDMYSDFRNSGRVNDEYEDFILHYWFARITWAIVAILLGGALLWMLL